MRIRAAMQAGKVRGQMNSEFYDRLNAYIGRYYVEPGSGGRIRPKRPSSGTVKDSLSSKQAQRLSAVLKEIGMSFHERLFQLITESGMKDAEVYKRADLDRKLFSKIRSNPAYHPGKDTVIALAIALKLDIRETEDLLSRAEYALSPSRKEDLVVRFFIENQIYDIDAVHEAISEYR